MSSEKASATLKRKHSDEENQPPNLAITTEQMETMVKNPMMQSLLRKKIKEEMKDEEKKQLSEEAKADMMREMKKQLTEEMSSKFVTMDAFSELAGVVYGALAAFAPATRIALYECTVYKFVEVAIPNNPDIDLIRHHMVKLCNYVMIKLREDVGTEQKKKMDIKPLTSMPDQEKLRLLLAALHGLKAYIDIAESDDVKTWNYAKRNQIMHGGAFLKCLCPPSSADKDGSTKYKAEVERMTKFQEDVEKAVTKRTYPKDEANINVAVLAIRTALTNKGVAVINEKSAKQIAKKVAEALKTPAARPEHTTASQSDDGRSD